MQDVDSVASPVISDRNGKVGIDRFVLYAERGIRLGRFSHAHGDIGVRTAATCGGDKSMSQVLLARHATCHDAFAPSIALDIYSEVHDVWTDRLTRAQDIGIGAEYAFPTDMPPLPLALAMGRGNDITITRHQHQSLPPGVYGTITLLYESELWLAAGTYTVAAVKMDEKSRLLGDPGGVVLRIVETLWMDRGATIGPHHQDTPARDFSIVVAGTDNFDNREDDDEKEIVSEQQTACQQVVVIGEEAHVHALLAAPHGTVVLKEHVRVKGAIAGFDIIACGDVHAEWQNGFPVSVKGQQGSQQLNGYVGVPGKYVGPLVGPVPADTLIPLAIGLPVRNPAGLTTFNSQVSDPKSPMFRQFLTQAQFKATYGATDADYSALQDWASNTGGFTIAATYSNNLLLTVQATAAEIEMALYVNLLFRQRSDGSQYVAVDRNPSLDLTVPVLEINGLNDSVLPKHANATGTNGANFRAADLRNAYLGVGSTFQSLNGAGQVVGIVDFATFGSNDVASYALAQLPVSGQSAIPAAPNVTVVATEGGNPAANSAIAATGDVELVFAMAPNVTILFFQGSTGITGHLDDILHAMATSVMPLTVASCSLGFEYSDNANQALGQMAANGVSFLTASGDGGSNSASSSANFVNQTLVGGTALNTNSINAGVYPSNYYAGEMAASFSAGGILGVPIPDYQATVSMATNGVSNVSRNYPDVAMVGVGLDVFFNGGFTAFNGTSAGAPLWAGLIALVNQANAQSGGPGKSGFLNPTIYDIGLTSGTADDLYSVCFNDITSGSNGAFTSVAGYDLCTGWGTPTGGLIAQLSSQTPLTPNQPLSLIRFVITTGAADLGGGLHGSGATATVALKNGDTFTLTLKTASQSNWNNGSIQTLDFPIPSTDDQGNPIAALTQSNGIAGVTINQVQSNPAWSANNWDIAALAVSLFNPGGPQECQLDLIGTSVLQDGSTGLVRLSLTAGSSGNGPSSPFFATGPGSGC